MTSIADYTSPALIIPQLRSQGGEGIVEELSERLEQEGRISDRPSFCKAVMHRELLSSSATAPGWALPHARMGGITRISFALGRSARPLDWPGQGQEGVRMVFLLAVPEAEARSYLTLISGLARLSQDPLRLEGLLQAPDSGALFEILRQAPLRRPARPSSLQATRL